MMSKRHLPGLLLAIALSAAPARAAVPGAATAQKAGLLAEITLARGQERYLVLDVGAGEIQIRIQGVVLRRLPVQVSVRLPGGMAVDDARWPAVQYAITGGLPQIERTVIRPPDKADGDSTATAAPPTESLLTERERALARVPAAYTLNCDPALTIAVTSDGSRPGHQRLGQRLAAGWARVTHRRQALRLELRMTVDDARRLALALTPGMPLVIRVAG